MGQPLTDEQKKNRAAIIKKIMLIEKYNYNQKEFTSTEMAMKLRKIIEEGLK
jgi:hypothetical protein